MRTINCFLCVFLMSMTASQPAYAEEYSSSGFVGKLLGVVSNITDDVIVIIIGLTTLVTVISVVRSGVMAQLNAQVGRKMGLSREILMVLETITIFIVAMITLPLVKAVVQKAVTLAGGINSMLGWNLRYP